MAAILIPISLAIATVLAFLVFANSRLRRGISRALLALIVFASTLAILWVAMVAVLLYFVLEPWPRSLRQGPDTQYSRECFEKTLGCKPAEDFSTIYCREEWSFGGDSVHSIRVQFRDSTAVTELIKHLALTIATSDQLPARYLSGPGWWPERNLLDSMTEVYERQGGEFIWVDRQNKIVYYQRAFF